MKPRNPTHHTLNIIAKIYVGGGKYSSSHKNVYLPSHAYYGFGRKLLLIIYIQGHFLAQRHLQNLTPTKTIPWSSMYKSLTWT